MKIRYYARWYDIWAGVFPDIRNKTVYVFLIPCILGFKIAYGEDSCKGYKEWTDGGYEYDCEYEYAGDVDCGSCMYGNHGGYLDPRFPYDDFRNRIRAFIYRHRRKEGRI